jgi:hypothetical protein
MVLRALAKGLIPLFPSLFIKLVVMEFLEVVLVKEHRLNLKKQQN